MALLNEDQALLVGAKLVAEAKTDLDGRFATVRQQVANAANSWAGGGADAFNQTMLSWDNSVKKVNDALLEFENSLKKTQSDFDETDDRMRQKFSRLNTSAL